MAAVELYCDLCDGVRWFEQPPCAEGHGAGCPEWSCTSCGAALLIDAPVMLIDRRHAARLSQELPAAA